MMKIRTFHFAAVLGGVLLLSGCHHQATGANGVPFPAPHAAPSAQAQIQNIQNDPHIPAAAKPGIEANIIHHNSTANPAPAKPQ